ncbi:DUF4019 domain-containing protein [Massilia sp.]|uniref:DUF4019 domain-containing protein n=1 Tax=Massilia sp. TaxID=1882437 RepID=UPI00289AD914|nr:DUF4019 domain-containing protein [Massilia sp.]
MVSGEVLQVVGKTAGIGGLALGVFLLIFRDIIRRNIFPKLSPTHAYRLITLIVSLTFLISAVGIGAYVYMHRISDDLAVEFPGHSPEPVILSHLQLIDNQRYGDAYARLSSDGKRRISFDMFTKVFETQRAPLGKALHRTFYGTAATRQLPDQTRGAFSITNYLSVFEKGRFFESVTVQAEDREWKVLFHTLAPCGPPVCP